MQSVQPRSMLYVRALVTLEARVPIWRFPKIGGTHLGVTIMRTIVFWGLYWVLLILGNYHIVGPWVRDSINLCRDLRTGTQYVGNWASRVSWSSTS